MTPGPEKPRSRQRFRLMAVGTLASAVVLGGGLSIAAAATPTASGSGSTAPALPSGAPTPPSGAPTPPSGAPAPPSGAARPSGAPAGPGQVAHQPRLAGKVKSVTGTQILITDPEGFTRTIVTSSTTTYSDSLTASPAVGTQIEAVGKVDANGTSLDATSIGKPKGPGGIGGPGGHGPGGPGRGGPGGPPPVAPGSSPKGSSSTGSPSSSSGATSTGVTTTS